MLRVEAVPTEPRILPRIGRAAILRGVYSAAEAEAFTTDFSSKAFSDLNPAIKGDSHELFNVYAQIDEYATLLETKSLKAGSQCIRTLGSLARDHEPDIDQLFFNKSLYWPELSVHRDNTLPWPALSFIVVGSGQIAYRYGGHVLFLPATHFGYSEGIAVAGDVLCLNNLSRSIYRRPLHSSMDGTGTRFALDFTTQAFVDEASLYQGAMTN
jgi:hypothetical protein